MKKTILALAMTSLFATSVYSATVYEKDDILVKIFGDTEVVYSNSLDKTESTKYQSMMRTLALN